MQAQPAESKEYYHARPKDPLVLPRPPLNHADRVPGHPERVGHRVQPLLRPLEHLALCPQVPEHRLAARDVLVQRRVGAGKEVLLPQRVVLARRVVAAHAVPATTAAPPQASPAARVPHVSPAAIAPIGTRRRRPAARAGGVRVLGRGGVGPPAEELAAVLRVQRLVARRLEGLKLPPVRRQLGAEVAYALEGLLLLGWVELLLGEGVVLVDGALEGGQGGAEGSQRRGAYLRGRGRGVAAVWVEGGGAAAREVC